MSNEVVKPEKLASIAEGKLREMISSVKEEKRAFISSGDHFQPEEVASFAEGCPGPEILKRREEVLVCTVIESSKMAELAAQLAEADWENSPISFDQETRDEYLAPILRATGFLVKIKVLQLLKDAYQYGDEAAFPSSEVLKVQRDLENASILVSLLEALQKGELEIDKVIVREQLGGVKQTRILTNNFQVTDELRTAYSLNLIIHPTISEENIDRIRRLSRDPKDIHEEREEEILKQFLKRAEGFVRFSVRLWKDNKPTKDIVYELEIKKEGSAVILSSDRENAVTIKDYSPAYLEEDLALTAAAIHFLGIQAGFETSFPKEKVEQS